MVEGIEVMAMKRRTKPDLSRGEGGWLDPEFIPPGVRKEWSIKHFNGSGMTPEQIDRYLAFANDWLQSFDDDFTPAKPQVEQIQAVADSARRLLHALGSLSFHARESLYAHTDTLRLVSSPEVELPDSVQEVCAKEGEFLEHLWDWASAAELAADYTAEQYMLSRQSKPKEDRARSIVAMMAKVFWQMMGRFPPKDRSSWFADLMHSLCEFIDLEAGPRIVSSGVELAEGTR